MIMKNLVILIFFKMKMDLINAINLITHFNLIGMIVAINMINWKSSAIAWIVWLIERL